VSSAVQARAVRQAGKVLPCPKGSVLGALRRSLHGSENGGHSPCPLSRGSVGTDVSRTPRIRGYEASPSMS
jgi:hypothetical protein